MHFEVHNAIQMKALSEKMKVISTHSRRKQNNQQTGRQSMAKHCLEKGEIERN